MRELERVLSPHTSPRPRLAVVGRGRLGTALAAALRRAGLEVKGPLGRGAPDASADVVILCVPDDSIAAAAAEVNTGPLLAHCSGATSLEVLGPRESFSLHPLMTVTHAGADFRGAGAAISATSERAAAVARNLAGALGMTPVEVAERDRALYHAAASVASNFLVTLEAAAERLGELAGLERSLLVPLVQATVENWAREGGRRALTGPVARGDQATVEAQREAIDERAPELLALFDAMVSATEALVAGARNQLQEQAA